MYIYETLKQSAAKKNRIFLVQRLEKFILKYLKFSTSTLRFKSE
jgi:hypothetical protein